MKENIGSGLPGIGLGDECLNLTPKAKISKGDHTTPQSSPAKAAGRVEGRPGPGETLLLPRL